MELPTLKLRGKKDFFQGCFPKTEESRHLELSSDLFSQELQPFAEDSLMIRNYFDLFLLFY